MNLIELRASFGMSATRFRVVCHLRLHSVKSSQIRANEIQSELNICHLDK